MIALEINLTFYSYMVCRPSRKTLSNDGTIHVLKCWRSRLRLPKSRDGRLSSSNHDIQTTDNDNSYMVRSFNGNQ